MQELEGSRRRHMSSPPLEGMSAAVALLIQFSLRTVSGRRSLMISFSSSSRLVQPAESGPSACAYGGVRLRRITLGMRSRRAS